jgi:hypothetical protein
MTLRDEMIEWLSECFEDEDFAQMSTGALMDGIQRHWDGGWKSFLDASDTFRTYQLTGIICVDVTGQNLYGE